MGLVGQVGRLYDCLRLGADGASVLFPLLPQFTVVKNSPIQKVEFHEQPRCLAWFLPALVWPLVGSCMAL